MTWKDKMPGSTRFLGIDNLVRRSPGEARSIIEFAAYSPGFRYDWFPHIIIATTRFSPDKYANLILPRFWASAQPRQITGHKEWNQWRTTATNLFSTFSPIRQTQGRPRCLVTLGCQGWFRLTSPINVWHQWTTKKARRRFQTANDRAWETTASGLRPYSNPSANGSEDQNGSLFCRKSKTWTRWPFRTRED